MAVEWKYVKPLKKADALESFCERQGVVLPDGLRAFLELNNGGRPSKPFFDTDKRSGYVFNSLYSFNEGDSNSVFDAYASAYVGSKLFPIGIEASGNSICTDLQTGALVPLNHETGKLEKIDYTSNPELYGEFAS